MERKIYKYILSQSGWVMMPINAKILHCSIQQGNICIWCLVDPNEKEAKRVINVIGTGWSVSSEVEDKYIGTVHQGEFVWHLFDGGFKP